MDITVSIVEECAEARQTLTDWIKATKGICPAGSHPDAGAALRQLLKDKPDVVLIEINLPDMSGIECIRRLKPLLPQTQFVVLTACEDIGHILEALAAGANGYLLKPTSRRKLVAALKDVCSGGSPMSRGIARKVVQSLQSAVPATWGTPAPCKLSPRQRQVLDFLALGSRYREIADSLDISVASVNTHIRRLFRKLQVRSARQLISRIQALPQNAGIEGSPSKTLIRNHPVAGGIETGRIAADLVI